VAVAALLLCLPPLLPACRLSAGGESGSLSVRLEYSDNTAADNGVLAGAGFAPSSAPRAPRAVPPYPLLDDNRILVRVFSPSLPVPVERWFSRSDRSGTVDGLPAGERFVVEVDEYDSGAATLLDEAPLLGRGRTEGVVLAAGVTSTVPVVMRAKGTIVTVMGEGGTAGDTGDGGLAAQARVGAPRALAVGPDGSLFVSSGLSARVRRIDPYGYVSHFAGDGTLDNVMDGGAAASTPCGLVTDLEAAADGAVYLVNGREQVFKVTPAGTVAVRYWGPTSAPPPGARPDLAVASDDVFFLTNGVANQVDRVMGGVRSPFVSGSGAFSEGVDRANCLTRQPVGVAWNTQWQRLVYCSTGDNAVRRTSLLLAPDQVYTVVGASPPSYTFADNLDALAWSPVLPKGIHMDPYSGILLLLQPDIHVVRYMDGNGRAHTLAGTAGQAGYEGDGGLATAAKLFSPYAVAADRRGNVYISDEGNHAVRMVVGGAHR
jgi:hypothetical protein